MITDVSGSSARELADWRCPTGSYADGLLLVGDHVLLTGDRGMGIEPMEDGKVGPIGRLRRDRAVSTSTSPTRPTRGSTAAPAGPDNQLSLRQYGDTVRLVTSTGLPSLPFVEPRSGRRTENEAEQRNREIVRNSTVEDWVPGLEHGVRASSTGSGLASRPLVGCDDVYHPKTWSGADTVAVATFTPGAVGDASAGRGHRSRERGLLLGRPALRHLHGLG